MVAVEVTTQNAVLESFESFMLWAFADLLKQS
jgi:hypothetical protein